MEEPTLKRSERIANSIRKIRSTWAIVLTYNFLLIAGILLTIGPTAALQSQTPGWETATWGLMFVIGAIMAIAGSVSSNPKLEFTGLVPLLFAITIFSVAFMTRAIEKASVTDIGLSFYLLAFASGALARLLQVYYGSIRIIRRRL